MKRRLAAWRHELAYLHDVTMCTAGFAFAFYLRLGEAIFGAYYGPVLLEALAIVAAIAAVVLRFFGLYRGVWAYASVRDLMQLTKAISVVVLISIVVLFAVTRLGAIPRSVPAIHWFVAIILLGGPRFAYRWLRDRRKVRRLSGTGTRRIPILLVGSVDHLDLMIRAFRNSDTAEFEVVGALDPKGSRQGRALHGVPVLGGLDDLTVAVSDLTAQGRRPQRLVLADDPARFSGDVLTRILDDAGALGLAVSRVPQVTRFEDPLADGRLELRPVAVEDLLGRPQAVLDREAIAKLVAGRRVLVTGAGGTIGGELSRQVAALGPARLILADNGEYNLYRIGLDLGSIPLDRRLVLCDVRDRAAVDRLFDEERPEIVFHAAALKHVPLVEDNPLEGVLTNVIGTRNVANACVACAATEMVLISTDKAVRPASVMGATKRLAEAYCQALDVEQAGRPDGGGTRFVTVRFGNVLGSSGSVVPLFQEQLARGGPLTVTHPDMKRYFMTVREAVELVLQASAYGLNLTEHRGRIFVLDMGEPVRIVDLARQMIRLAGLRPEIDVAIEFTGVRPGEKLFEEFLDPEETLVDSRAASGVFIVETRPVDGERLFAAIVTLRDLAGVEIRRAIFDLIDSNPVRSVEASNGSKAQGGVEVASSGP